MSVRARLGTLVALVLLLSGCLGEPYPPRSTSTAPTGDGVAGSTSTTTTDPGLGGVAPTPSPTTQQQSGDLLGKAHSILQSWHSVHATGTLNRDGLAMAFDLAGTADGGSLHGTVSVGSAPSVEVLRVDGVDYVRTSALRGGQRYVRMTADPVGPLDLGRIMGDLDRVVTHAHGGSADPETPFEGTPAVRITLPGNDTSIILAADGTSRPGLPLRLVTGSGGDTSTISFDSWDAVPPLRAPTPQQLEAVPGS